MGVKKRAPHAAARDIPLVTIALLMAVLAVRYCGIAYATTCSSPCGPNITVTITATPTPDVSTLSFYNGPGGAYNNYPVSAH